MRNKRSKSTRYLHEGLRTVWDQWKKWLNRALTSFSVSASDSFLNKLSICKIWDELLTSRHNLITLPHYQRNEQHTIQIFEVMFTIRSAAVCGICDNMKIWWSQAGSVVTPNQITTLILSLLPWKFWYKELKYTRMGYRLWNLNTFRQFFVWIDWNHKGQLPRVGV